MHDARCMIWCYSDVDMICASMHNGIEIYHDGWDAWYDATMMQIWLMLEWCEYDWCMMYEICQDIYARMVEMKCIVWMLVWCTHGWRKCNAKMNDLRCMVMIWICVTQILKERTWIFFVTLFIFKFKMMHWPCWQRKMIIVPK